MDNVLFWIGMWYLSGLVGILLTDYVECKIVNREYYEKVKLCWGREEFSLTCYLGGIRPPAYQVILFSFTGLAYFLVGIHSIYHYLKGTYGEFDE